MATSLPRWCLSAICGLALLSAVVGAVALAVPGNTTIVTDLSADAKPVLLVDGVWEGKCVQDSLFVAAASSALGSVTSATACPGEVALFAMDHAALVRSYAWSGADDELALVPQNPVEVKLNIWVVSNRTDALQWALNDVEHAARLYNQNRAGLVFAVQRSQVVPRSDPDKPETMSDEERAIGGGCPSVPGLKGSASPVYESAMLNVYFIETLLSPDNDYLRGWSCTEPGPSHADNVIYVSLFRHSPTTLAHELGHAFGLRGETGHPNDRMDAEEQGFSATNVMWSYLDASEARARDHFSLGQVYRMVFHQESWLNKAGPRGSQVTPPPTRNCSSNPLVTGRCPRLGLDWPEGAK